MTERPIRFFHRGRIVEVGPDVPATRSVLQWLREDARATGTKEGCAEGDCGACTVVLGRLEEDGQLSLQPVNACLQFLPTLDGKALFTVEDLRRPDGGLHPVQQALRDCHGSQCGFCTPGFVMSLWACHEHHTQAGTQPSRQQLADALSGNLCRCTGYRPILEAGQRMFDLPGDPLDRAPMIQALRELQHDAPLSLGTRYHAPRTIEQLAALSQAQPEARLLAGGTDVGLWVTKQLRELPALLYVGEVAELRRIEVGDGLLRIGAGAPLEAAWQALATHWPALREVGLRFASPPVRSVGTMGGNVANGSPIGDSAPVLIALDARLVLRQGAAIRRLPLQDFYLDYMRNALRPGEFVQGLELPLPVPGQAVQAYKIAKRFDSDISAVCLGAALRLQDGRVRDARLAFGGMAGIVRRAAAAEAALVGQPWTEATARAAMAALEGDFQPLTDLRASRDYRMQVAQNLIMRLWLQTRPEAPLSAHELSVWAREEAA